MATDDPVAVTDAEPPCCVCGESMSNAEGGASHACGPKRPCGHCGEPSLASETVVDQRAFDGGESLLWTFCSEEHARAFVQTMTDLRESAWRERARKNAPPRPELARVFDMLLGGASDAKSVLSFANTLRGICDKGFSFCDASGQHVVREWEHNHGRVAVRMIVRAVLQAEGILPSGFGGRWFESTGTCSDCIGTGRSILIIPWSDGSRKRVGLCETCNGFGAVYDEKRKTPNASLLVAWASLGAAAILRAEMLARRAADNLVRLGGPAKKGAERAVVWRASRYNQDMPVTVLGHTRDFELTRAGVFKPGTNKTGRRGTFGAVGDVADLYRMGIMLDCIEAARITLTVPSVAGAP